ncbi:MAG: hypothetical protein QXG05_08935, partial [Nitrososphaerota archaeon]
MEDSGGGTPKEFETIHEFIEKFTAAKAMVKARMKIYQMLTMATPLGLAILVFVMSTFLTLFGASGAALNTGIINTSIPPSLFSASYIMVIVSAAFMSLTAGVASDFTIKNAWRVSVSVLLASITIFLLTNFGGAIVGLLPHSL